MCGGLPVPRQGAGESERAPRAGGRLARSLARAAAPWRGVSGRDRAHAAAARARRRSDRRRNQERKAVRPALS